MKSSKRSKNSKHWLSKMITGIVSAVVGFASLSAAFASVPSHVTNDTALYQNLSEIKVAREKELNFDRDIAKLALAEGKYRERLPQTASMHPRVKTPMQRISQRPYHYTGNSVSRATR